MTSTATLGAVAEIGWVSDDPHLSGNFAPVGREVNVADLPVVAGRIPADLRGVYMRNGPNLLFSRCPTPIRSMATAWSTPSIWTTGGHAIATGSSKRAA